jgi:transketolase
MSNSQYAIGDKINTRDLIGRALCAMAEEDDRIWAITSDSGANLAKFAAKYKNRFVDTGIAEQNAAGVAAGLALSGAVVYIMGMSPFVTMRAFEQNRTAIAYQNLNVRIIGTVGGLATGAGSTHYAMEDIALMRSIVNMAVISLSDPLLAPEILEEGLKHEGPFYLRMTSGKSDPVIYEPGSVHFAFGKEIVARQGNDVALLVHGGFVGQALSLSDNLKAEKGIGVRVIDMCSIKPLDAEVLIAAAQETKIVIAWEDHFTFGGLASAVGDLFVDRHILPRKFLRVGIPQVYPGFGSTKELYGKFGMDADAVKRLILQNL